MIKKSQYDDYLIVYKRYREFYMAERNFMLTSSALIAYFVFQQLLSLIKNLARTETSLEESKAKKKLSE